MKPLFRALASLLLFLTAGDFALAAANDPAPPSATAPAQSSLESVRLELEAMRKTDQSQRQLMDGVQNEHGQNSPEMDALWKKQKEIDDHNIQRLEEIIAVYGWPGRSLVGEQAASGVFLIVQHAGISYQKKYLPQARAALAANEMRPSSFALLEDRVLTSDELPQIYGSQVHRNDAGVWAALPIADEAHVDERRAAMGLPPLANYLQGFAQRSGGKVGDSHSENPAASAAPLTQSLFADDDNAPAAFAKLRAVKVPRGDDAVQFQFACRDFCARFPNSAFYAQVRMLAVNAWPSLREPELSQLKDWDPTDAQNDLKVDEEQRGRAAVLVASIRAMRQSPRDANFDEVQFDAIAQIIPAHWAARSARNGLIRTALNVAPEKAIPRLRELYPDDADIAACIKALEALGQPCELQFTALDGRPIDLRDYRGKVVEIVFWAAGAGGSTSGLPQLQQLAERSRPEDFAILGIMMDDNRATAEEFAQKNALAWPLYFDNRGWENEVAQRFLIKAIPSYLLIDRQGNLRSRGIGPALPATTSRIETLLAEKPPVEKSKA